MSEILLEIDDQKVKATEGMTVLEAAKSMGISIPTLCYYKEMTPGRSHRLKLPPGTPAARSLRPDHHRYGTRA